MPRLFYGVDLPDELKKLVRQEQTRLKEQRIEANGWSNPALLHVTSLFIGVVDDTYLPTLIEAGQTAAAAVQPFTLTTGPFGVFPQNKVLWMGFSEQGSNLKALLQLHDELKARLEGQLPVELDSRPYRPHVTLARKLRDATRLKKMPVQLIRSFDVTELCLFESVRVDGQLQYPIRHRFLLGN